MPLAVYEGVARGLLGDDLADRLAIPKPWYARPMVAAMRTAVHGLELARRAVPGMNGLATRTGHGGCPGRSTRWRLNPTLRV